MVGDAENAPPSMLYCTLKPATIATVGKVNAVLQVLAGATITGAAGKITTLTVLLTQEPGPALPAGIVSQLAANTYRACTVWQPGVVGMAGVEVKPLPSILY